MMRVLMICTKYPLNPSDRYMTNELAGALVAAGHRVQVVVTEWDAPFGTPTTSTRSNDGVDILAVAPRAILRLGRFVQTASKWLLSSLFARREMLKAIGAGSFDTLICFSPCTTVWAQLLWAMRRWPMRSILYLHDFFPYHHHSIGLIPGGAAFQAARLIEQSLIRRFDVIGCMSPMNIEYLRKHYRLGATQQVTVHPIWGETTRPALAERASTRTGHGLPLDRKIAVFGGQITEGRGIEDILAAAAILNSERSDVSFLVIGEGRLAELVRRASANPDSNVQYRPRIPRAEYLGLIAACDIGIVCTVADVDVPSFPSKIIDYLRARLPVIAAVEATTDYGRFVEARGVGLSIAAGDPRGLADAISKITDGSDIASGMSDAAQSCLDEVFDVRRAVIRIEEAMVQADI
jgi:glycosyltransferase involved in cell wall biosynthesis